MPQVSTPAYLFLATLAGASIGIIYSTYTSESSPLCAALGLSGLSFCATFALITWLGPAFVRRGLNGKDLLKKDQGVLPESMGVVVACVHLMAMMAFIPIVFMEYFVVHTDGGGNRNVEVKLEVEGARGVRLFPHNRVGTITSYGIQFTNNGTAW